MFTLKKHRTTTTTSSPSSVTSITYLHDDILVEIISKLPIKHMVSCKSVSKKWHKLIVDLCIPRITSCPVFGLLYSTCLFPNNHDTVKRGPLKFACVNVSDQITNASLVESFISNILPFRPSPYEFLDCSNGLLLFFDKSSKQYYVCNPSTQQYVTIPNTPSNNIPIYAFLTFDPHFKVVHIWGETLTVNIFSFTTGQWEVFDLDIDPSLPQAPLSMRYISFCGSFYRLTVAGYLLKFSVTEKYVRPFQLPKIVVKEIPIGCLGVSQGCLHYAWDDQISQMMVWTFVESDHTDNWVLKHNICLQFFEKHPCRSKLHDPLLFSVLAFHPTSDILFVGNGSGIFRYDTATGRLHTVCILRNDTKIYAPEYVVYLYSVNLTSLDAYCHFTNAEITGENLVSFSFHQNLMHHN